MKRFQECNRAEKLWRYRWYAIIPVKYLYYNYLRPFKVLELDDIGNHTGSYRLKGKNLWKILIGDAQGHMKWYYTMKEVRERIDKLKK